MAKLIYSAITSLDGYVAVEDGNFDWAAPDEEDSVQAWKAEGSKLGISTPLLSDPGNRVATTYGVMRWNAVERARAHIRASGHRRPDRVDQRLWSDGTRRCHVRAGPGPRCGAGEVSVKVRVPTWTGSSPSVSRSAI